MEPYSPNHKELVSRRMIFSGEISFWETKEVANIESLIFFGDSLCEICISSPANVYDGYRMRAFARQLRRGGKYLSSKQCPYERHEQAEVQIVISSSSFRLDDARQMLRIEGAWIDLPGDRDAVEYGFHGALFGEFFSEYQPDRTRLRDFLAEFKK